MQWSQRRWCDMTRLLKLAIGILLILELVGSYSNGCKAGKNLLASATKECFEEDESREFNVSDLDLCIFDQHERNDCLPLNDYPNNANDSQEVFTIILNSTFILVNRTRESSATDTWRVRVHNGTLLFATKGSCTVENDTITSWQHILLLEADSCSISSSTDPGPSSTPTTFTISSSTGMPSPTGSMPSPTGSMPSPSASMDATIHQERCKEPPLLVGGSIVAIVLGVSNLVLLIVLMTTVLIFRNQIGRINMEQHEQPPVAADGDLELEQEQRRQQADVALELDGRSLEDMPQPHIPVRGQQVDIGLERERRNEENVIEMNNLTVSRFPVGGYSFTSMASRQSEDSGKGRSHQVSDVSLDLPTDQAQN